MNTRSRSSADLVEVLLEKVEELRGRANTKTVLEQLNEAIEDELPVFIYFENYGILDSAVYLPRFLEDLTADPEDPRIRTIDAMFKHVQLTAAEVANLGQEKADDGAISGSDSYRGHDTERPGTQGIAECEAEFGVARHLK